MRVSSERKAEQNSIPNILSLCSDVRQVIDGKLGLPKYTVGS